MRYIDEQAEAIIADGGTVECIEMGWPQFHALKMYTLEAVPSSVRHIHPEVPVRVVADSRVQVRRQAAATDDIAAGEQGR